MEAANFDVPNDDEPEARCGHVAVTWNDSVYIWGGYRDATSNNPDNPHRYPIFHNPRIVWEYNLNRKKWIKHVCKGYVPMSRLGSVAVCVRGTLVLFGGCGHFEDRNDLHILKLTTPNMEWKEIKPDGTPPSPRNKLSCVHYRDQIIYFGGYGPKPSTDQINNGTFDEDISSLRGFMGEDRGWNNHLFGYSIEKNEWTTLQNGGERPRTRAAHCCERVNDHCYLFGGRHKTSRLDDLFQLNLDSFNWTEIKRRNEVPWPVGRSWHTLTECGENNVLLLSGFDSETNVMDDGWFYTIETQTWQRIPYIKFPRLWHSTTRGVYNGQVVTIAGCSSNIFEEQTTQERDITIHDLQPKPLLRMCLEASSKTAQKEWQDIPHFLRNKIRAIGGG